MKAILLYHQKERFHDRYLLEITIHEVGKSVKYPDGIKYGLLLLDLISSQKVLMDNHHPKGHHIHLNDNEFPYNFRNDERLVEDFKTLVLEHMGVAI